MPPTNHLAQGYFHSKTLFHGENHSNSCATLPQNVSGSAIDCWYSVS